MEKDEQVCFVSSFSQNPFLLPSNTQKVIMLDMKSWRCEGKTRRLVVIFYVSVSAHNFINYSCYVIAKWQSLRISSDLKCL